MITGFCEWLLIIIVLVLIFNANNLSTWKAFAHKKIEHFKKVAADKNRIEDLVRLRDDVEMYFQDQWKLPAELKDLETLKRKSF